MSDQLLDGLLAAAGPEGAVALRGTADLTACVELWSSSLDELGLPIDCALLAGAIVPLLGADVPGQSLPVADLYLAAACARGDDDAVRCFDALLGGQLDRAIAKSPTLGLAAPEFRQLVYDRLFVGESGALPKIAKYGGQGSLKGWLRVLASRFIVDLSRRKDRRTSSDTGLAERISARDDVELEYLRHAYGPAVQTAFEQAIADLAVRERNLLRQRYLLDVSGDQLAVVYSVHRSTVFAWLDKARAQLLHNVRTALAEQIGGAQLESVVGVLGSRLDVSIRRMLDSQLESEPEPEPEPEPE